MPLNVVFKCPWCDAKVKASVDLVGEVAECPSCNKDITIPAPKFREAAPMPPPVQRKSEPEIVPVTAVTRAAATTESPIGAEPPLPQPPPEIETRPSWGEKARPLVASSKSGDIVELHEHKIIINRSIGVKLLLQGLKGHKEIPIRSIAAIQFKPAGVFLSGFLQFTLVGGIESTRGWQQAGLDENTVEFVLAEEPEFRRLKEAVDAKMEALSAASQFPRPAAAAADPIAQLERLATLRTQGVLTDEEFAEQKAKLLGAI